MKTVSIAWLLVLLTAGGGCRGASDPPALSVSVVAPAEPVFIGDPVRVTIRVYHPREVQVRIPRWETIRADGPVERAGADTTANRGWARGRRISERTWEVFSFTPGEHRLFAESAAVTLTDTDGQRTRLAIPGDPAVQVESVLTWDEASDDGPDADPLDWPRAVPVWLWAIPLVAVLAGLAGILVRRALRRPREAGSPGAPVSPREWALAALQRLRESGAIEAGPAEPFYRELSSIVRRYLEDRFGLHAPERTTEEFFREAAQSGRLSADQRVRVNAFLSECDLVKFARHEPGSADRRTAWDTADRVIRETAPEPGEGAI